MFLHNAYVLAVTNDLEEVLVANEVKSGKGSPLCLKIVTESFLDIGEHIDDSSESLLQSLDVHGFDDIGLGRNLFHQGSELGIDPLEPGKLVKKHLFDVR